MHNSRISRESEKCVCEKFLARNECEKLREITGKIAGKITIFRSYFGGNLASFKAAKVSGSAEKHLEPTTPLENDCL